MKITNKALFTLLLISFFIFSNFLSSNGQETDRWDFMVGGDFSLSSNTIKLKNDNASEDISSEFSFNIKPVFGYFFTDNIAIGIIINYDYAKYSSIEKSNSISAGPFLRTYLGDSYVKPFIHLGVGFGNYKYLYDPSNNFDDIDINAYLFNYNLGGGIAFFLNEYVALEVIVHYNNTSLKPRENNEENIKEVYSKVSLDVGFQVFL
jgi:hypothetical protein